MKEEQDKEALRRIGYPADDKEFEMIQGPLNSCFSLTCYSVKLWYMRNKKEN